MNNFDAKREGEETNRVTLENLLRLKRHERPLSEFWEDFDVELKERTLQSVVRKKTWFAAFQACLVNPWTFCISASAVALAFLIYFPLDERPGDPRLSPSAVSEVSGTAVAIRLNIIEAFGEVEFIDGALVLSDSDHAEFNTSFSSNDLRAISLDSTTYVEENLTTLLAESEPDDHRAIF